MKKRVLFPACLLMLGILLVTVGCNPFISQDLRKKNKCNRKIERELKRHKKKAAKINIICPGALVSDTIRDTLEVEVEIPATDIDSFLVIEKDTATIDSLMSLIRDQNTRKVIRKYIMKYQPINDTVIHVDDGYTIKFWSHNGKINYSIDKPKTIKVVEVPTETIIEQLKPLKLTNWEKILNVAGDFWWIAVIIVILFFLIRFLWKRFF